MRPELNRGGSPPFMVFFAARPGSEAVNFREIQSRGRGLEKTRKRRRVDGKKDDQSLGQDRTGRGGRKKATGRAKSRAVAGFRGFFG